MQAREKSAMDAAKEVDREFALENRQSKEQIELEMLADTQNSERKKNQFIGELKGGLGEKIKEAPTQVRFIKDERTFWDKLKDLFKKF